MEIISTLLQGVSRKCEPTVTDYLVVLVISTCTSDKFEDFALINCLKKENPEWFDLVYEHRIQEMCENAFEAESAIIDWIYEKGEIDFLVEGLASTIHKIEKET